MVKFIETELEDLGREVDQMWTLVYNQMEQAQQAVLEMDRGAAQQIMVRERRVDAFELKIDSDVEDFIALYTPVAVDLRYVLSMLKINNDLERIGDYADGIARFVRDCDAQSLDPELVEKLQLRTMFSTVLEMLKELQEALREENAAKATAVADKDDLLDKINRASTGILTDYAIAHKEAIPLCIGFGSVFRKLERTGDHLTNIAEEAPRRRRESLASRDRTCENRPGFEIPAAAGRARARPPAVRTTAQPYTAGGRLRRSRVRAADRKSAATRMKSARSTEFRPLQSRPFFSDDNCSFSKIPASKG